uniref:NADH dehydrogenase subunit 4 n=1 Tax=Marmessoidea bispina TaxID=2878957 RepID=UPI0025A9F225|nr:NADH dehydrogenase subunit 4 [Marmessoidea bispina]WID87076.1 NADH dehydrogenase subunit 4 [Marmessoidea bispina]
MLSILFMILFMIPLLYFNSWWLLYNLLFISLFLSFFIYTSSYYMFHLSYFLGCDVYSYCMILLSFFICSLMILASGLIYYNLYYNNLFIFFVLLLLVFLYLSFSSSSFIMFYLFFESSLIPTMFLIFGWGYQPERLQAGMYFLFYTLFSSLPMLLAILYFYFIYGSLSFFLFFNLDFCYFIFYLCMILSFLVKMPMFFFHMWLPKAHVEAPICGSMILAGVLLKLGGYGLFRVFNLLFISGMSYNYFLISIGLVGGLLISFVCLRQSDLKSLIAYSSIIHMGLVFCGIMSLNYWGIYGSLILMIAHGLCSSGLFCLANIVYERLGSRSLYIIKGMINFMPTVSLWWFLLSSYNMAAPPSLNLMGEIMLFNSLVSWDIINSYIFVLMSFFSAAYTLYMYSYSQHGVVFSGSFSFCSGYLREYLLLFLHWFPLNLIIFMSNMFFM